MSSETELLVTSDIQPDYGRERPPVLEVETGPSTHHNRPVTTTVVDISAMERSPIVQTYNLSCIVCYDALEIQEFKDLEHSMCVIEAGADCSSYLTLPCCSRLVCKACIENIISTTVNEGRVQISCPHPECGEQFTTEYVYSMLGGEVNTKQRYQRLLVDLGSNDKIKTCPQCSHLTEHVLPRRFRLTEEDLKITCEVCDQEWCFRCHAPWHTDMSCKEFKNGNRDFKAWTKSKERGIANCQKCPTCRIYIQRSTGCPHMVCDRCGTDFCYDCGGRFLDLDCIDVDHYSTLNVWGCKKNYHEDEPCIRNCVRWGYLLSKLAYVIAYPVLFIAALVLLIILVFLCTPVYCTCKLCSYVSYRKERNQIRKSRSHYRRFN